MATRGLATGGPAVTHRTRPLTTVRLRATLAWTPLHTFESGLQQTVDWYLQNKARWKRVRSGAYQAYYEQQYGRR